MCLFCWYLVFGHGLCVELTTSVCLIDHVHHDHYHVVVKTKITEQERTGQERGAAIIIIIVINTANKIILEVIMMNRAKELLIIV